MSSLDKAAWALRDATDAVKGFRFRMEELNFLLERVHEFVDATVIVDESREFLKFLDQHPELREGRPALSFTDEELLDALRAACDEWAEYYRELHAERARTYGVPSHPSTYGASSSSVASILAGLTAVGRNHHEEPEELRPTDGEVIRVGQRLARLVKAGRVRQVSSRWNHRQWAPVEEGDYA